MNEERIRKAREAQDPQALLELAEQNRYPMTLQQAEALYASLHRAGALGDEELENVSGGGCGDPEKPAHRPVTSETFCFAGKYEFGFYVAELVVELSVRCRREDHLDQRWQWFHESGDTTWGEKCGSCFHLEFKEDGTGYCGVGNLSPRA